MYKRIRNTWFIYISLLINLVLVTSCDNTDITSDQADVFIKYNGNAGDYWGNDIAQSPDGNYFITGAARISATEQNLIIIQTDRYGNQIGDIKYFGGLGTDEGNSVQVALDGSVYIVGTYTKISPVINTDVCLLKLSSGGDTLWTKTFGGDNDDVGNSVLIDTEGNIVISGYTKSFGNGGADGIFIKTDTDGNLIEAIKSYGFEFDDYINSMVQYQGGYYLIGETYNYHSDNKKGIFLIKANTHGTAIDYGVIERDDGDLVGNGIAETNAGNLIICGTLSNVDNSIQRTYLADINSNLYSINWETILTDDGNISNDIDIINNQIIVLSTLNTGNNNHTSINLNHTDMDGNLISSTPLGSKSGYLKANSFRTTSDGGLIIVGSNAINNDEVIAILKLNNKLQLY